MNEHFTIRRLVIKMCEQCPHVRKMESLMGNSLICGHPDTIKNNKLIFPNVRYYNGINWGSMSGQKVSGTIPDECPLEIIREVNTLSEYFNVKDEY